MSKPILLVLCTGNSARSQLAEALLRQEGGDLFEVHSAGTAPKGIHPMTVRVLEEMHIDLSGHRSKHLDEYLGKVPVHVLITVCGAAEESCPTWPGAVRRLHWPFEDPAACTGTEAEQLAKFRQVRDQIQERVRSWVAQVRCGEDGAKV